jgi:serine/threonine protein kinase
VNLPSFLFKELVNKDEIGRGGFSSVFTAELQQTGEKVAVKKFLGNDQIDGKIFCRFTADMWKKSFINVC